MNEIANICVYIRHNKKYLVLAVGFSLLLSLAAHDFQPPPRPGGAPPDFVLPLWKKAEIEQTNYCKHLFKVFKDHMPPIYTLTNNLTYSELNLYVYSGNDTVSRSIRNIGSWQAETTRKVLYQMKRTQASRHLRPSGLTFVDIGSHLGWFSSVMADHGYRVISFEPMPTNEILIRSNMCLQDPEGKKRRWTLFNFGLSNTTENCRLIARKENTGNGIVVCKKDKPIPDTHEVRGYLDTYLLDEIITPEILNDLEIGFVKMDVENFEYLVIEGGMKFFSSPKVTHMLLEFWPMGDPSFARRNLRVYQLLTQAGWKLSWKGIGGPRVDPSLKDQSTDAYGDAWAWKDIR